MDWTIDGEKVRKLRGDRTQAEVAYGSKMSTATLSAIENGHTINAKTLTVGKLAMTLGVKPGELMKVG